MKKHQELMRDPLAYVESIGKNDQQHVRDALADEGRDSVLRICLSPKGDVPMRALGYVAAAQYIHAVYMPKAQLQVIVPEQTIKAANGIDDMRTRSAAQNLFNNLFFVPTLTPRYQIIGGKQVESTIFAKDKPVPSYFNVPYFESVLRDVPEVGRLRAQAARRTGSDFGSESYLHYFAGHIRMHDGKDSIVPYFQGDQYVPVQAERIISIGAKSERPFYKARMAYRQGIRPDPTLARSTGQIFTNHVLPPYQPRRQPPNPEEYRFDPVGLDMEALGSPLLDDSVARYDSVVRDITHLRNYMQFALRSFVSDKELAQ